MSSSNNRLRRPLTGKGKNRVLPRAVRYRKPTLGRWSRRLARIA